MNEADRVIGRGTAQLKELLELIGFSDYNYWCMNVGITSSLSGICAIVKNGEKRALSGFLRSI